VSANEQLKLLYQIGVADGMIGSLELLLGIQGPVFSSEAGAYPGRLNRQASEWAMSLLAACRAMKAELPDAREAIK